MTKSISKKILIFLLSAFTVVCALLFAFNGLTANAEGEYKNTYGSQSVTSDAEAELRKDELLGYIAQYKSVLSDKILVSTDSYWVFDVKEVSGISIDDEAVKSAVDKIDFNVSKGDWDAVNKSLFGDVGLNGILGIYERISAFYSDYVVVDGQGYCKVASDNLMTAYTAKNLVDQATEALKNLKLQNFAQNNYSVYDAENWVSDFSNDNLVKLINESQTQKAELKDYVSQVEYYRSFYFSERYGRAYVNEVVYNSKTNVDEEESQKVVFEVQKVFAESLTYADAKRKMTKLVDDYVKQIAQSTVLERNLAEIIKLENSQAKPAKIISACEKAFDAHESLGTIDHYKKDENGEHIKIDLKTGKPVGDATDMGDGKVLNDVLLKYKNAIEVSINDEKQKVLSSNTYGISAESKISDYVKYAKGIVSALGKYGRLPENADVVAGVGTDGYKATQYSYGDKQVVNGTDVLNAFKDCFTIDGALVVVYNDKRQVSEALDEYLLKSSLVYEKKDESGAVQYVVTLTCVDSNGNEVNYFDGESVLYVSEGASLAVERNINLALGRRFKKATKDLGEADVQLLQDRVFFEYFTLTVSSPKYAGGPLDVLEMDKTIRVVISIEFKNAEVLAKIKEKVCAFSYNHTEINNVYSDVTWGDTTMKFTIPDFANQAQFALSLEGKTPKDWLLIGAIALAGLVVMFFVIWLIVAIVKNRKFKIFFNACGGKYNSSIKVKLHEKFNHPAAPVKPGYVFQGWYLDLKCTVKFAMTELSKKGKITVYAKWISEEDFNEINEEYEKAVKPEIPAPVEEVVETPAPVEEVVEETAPVEEVVEEVVEETAPVEEVVETPAPTKTVDFESAIEKAKAETEAKLREEIEELRCKIKALEEARVVAPAPVEEKAEEVAEESVEESCSDFDVVHAFDVLKAEIYSYTDADDLGFGLDAKVDACAMKVVGKTVELEVNLDLEDCQKKGYKVVKGDKLAVKFVVACDCCMDEAFELIEETMFINGLEKTEKAVITESTEETRTNGFEYGVSKDKVADTVEEFYKLLRVYTQSFVLADDGDAIDKALVKMFMARGKIYAYVNYSAEGLNACDPVMVEAGYKSFMTIKNSDDCRKALEVIGAMMKENGLVRFPSKVEMAGADCKDGFTYTLKK